MFHWFSAIVLTAEPLFSIPMASSRHTSSQVSPKDAMLMATQSSQQSMQASLHSLNHSLACTCAFVFATGGIEAINEGEKELVGGEAVALTELVVT